VGVVLALGLGGCDNSAETDEAYNRGLEKGLAEGFDLGYQEGKQEGKKTTTLKYETQWGLTGLSVGALLGAGLVALLTQGYLSERYRAWSNRKTIAKWMGACEVDLDADVQERVVQIASRKRRLEEELAKGGGRLIASANAPLVGTLAGMNRGVLRLATLLQQLRGIRDEVGVDEGKAKERVAMFESALARTGSDFERAEIAQSLAIERQKLDASLKNRENIRRCEMKLESLHGFLDRLLIEMGNMRTLEQQGSFEQYEGRVGAELEQLRRTYEVTLANLLENVDGAGARQAK
jgi:hypothetical protein